MAATLAPAINFHNPRGHVRWVILAATALAPTRTQINAGTDYSFQITGNDGWGQSSDQFSVGVYGTRQNFNVPGDITFGEASLTFGLDPTGADIRSALHLDDAVTVLRQLNGDIPTTGKQDIFTATVASISAPYEMGSAAMATVAFSLNGASFLQAIPA